MAEKNSAAIRKRAQINKANRTMFLWIAVSSAIIGSAVVVALFLGQQLLYNEKILAEKATTIQTLEANSEVIPELETEIRILDTNEALATSKANDDDQTVQVILDALPSDANSLALGASLQTKLLTGVQGLRIESLQVDPVVGVESAGDLAVVDAGLGSSDYQINFQFSVSGDQQALRKVLENLERSIRLIDIQVLRIESQSSTQLMTVQARAFYEPAKTLELTDKVVQQ
ncbi:MAG TPA: GspMb/PilO family protein [Candidatus Saccharimonadaceae bacterium]|nr:GspMb/PilO family protein [Candidatus Saccharimonadaceae bacterium]|tara:strand:+ start:302 stop:991 length:690 start_codon:yes stop_codon:yes gene_type:complete